jgi:tRNA modification GTPase
LAAIGIVRISGPEAIEAADKVFRISGGGRLADAEARRMYFGELYNALPSDEKCRENHSPDTLIDLCLCVISRGSFSYTGEDSVEFHCHGSPVVLSEVLRALSAHGVRQALPGEFTKRAFLNGRLDLSQAEAIIDLIEAETQLAARNAAGQLRGAIRARLEPVYSTLIDIMAHFHAALDYPDEDIDEFKLQDYYTVLGDSKDTLTRLTASHERGRIIRDGLKTAIVGRPNSGKSSLLNALLGYDRAIVTDIAGTTRDTGEEKILVGSVVLRLIDTAGLRQTDEPIEKLGVERSLSALENAGLVLLVLDGSEKVSDDVFDILLSVKPRVPKIIVFNKSDLPEAGSESFERVIKTWESRRGELENMGASIIRVSALTGDGLSDLEIEIERYFPVRNDSPPGEIITNTRQYEAIQRAESAIGEAMTAITTSLTPDAILTEIEAALQAIGEVTGKSMREDIVSRIFERFCVGK